MSMMQRHIQNLAETLQILSEHGEVAIPKDDERLIDLTVKVLNAMGIKFVGFSDEYDGNVVVISLKDVEQREWLLK